MKFMKVLCYLQCIINTVLTVIGIISVISERSFNPLNFFVIISLTAMVMVGWYLLLRATRKEPENKK